MTPSIQEYHTRNCLMFKKHTNLWSLEETQRLASTVARQVVSQSTMKFASDSPQFSYVELTLLRTN
ncbi:hypothetical protein [Leptospira noguchii]|uniref:hypothetical protein n=2 Tax=Leptospira noguchii TaxID=28182 RepID=UPI0015EFBA03|nr:hypothetical protein [Leptospira noguchii]